MEMVPHLNHIDIYFVIFDCFPRLKSSVSIKRLARLQGVRRQNFCQAERSVKGAYGRIFNVKALPHFCALAIALP